MSDTITDKISTNAAGPKVVTGDSGAITQFPMADLIAADRYNESKAASQATGLGLKFNKIKPPGASG